MKTIIAGSRDIKDPIKAVEQAVRESGFFPDMTEVVSGTARDVDQAGESYARVYGLPIKRFPADWKAFGKSAGFIRNRLMAEYADAGREIADSMTSLLALALVIYPHRNETGESS